MVLGLELNFSALYIVFGIATILYIYLWLHDTNKAMDVTTAIFNSVINIGKVLFKIIIAIVNGIYNLISRFWR